MNKLLPSKNPASFIRSIKTIRLTKQQKRSLFLALIVLFGAMEPFISPAPADASSATGYLRLDRMAQNTATGGDVCFNPKTNETTVRQMDITFPVSGTPGTADSTHFGVNQTAANWTWDTTATNLPPGASAFPGTATTSTVSSGDVTFIVTADQSLNTGTLYCLHFTGTSTLTTPTSANSNLTGAINLRNSGGTILTSETVNYATADVSNDQVTVTASVTSTFSFSLGSNTAALGNLATSGAPTTASVINATVSTNAQNGFIIWAKNANANSALTSASTGDGICLGGNYPTCTGAAFQTGSGNVHSLSGAAGYGLSAAAGTGSPTIATEYNGSSTSFGSLDSTKFEKVSSSSGPTSSNVTQLTFGAEASTTNKAATDYTDTVTFTAAASF